MTGFSRLRIFTSSTLRVTLVLAAATLMYIRAPAPEQSGECTMAFIRPEVTADGRPLIWKNRDVTNRNQVVHQGGGNGFYRYVGIGYAGDGARVYGGLNEIGFAIANSNSYNLGSGNQYGTADDGTLMTNALKTCASLEQLRRLLDSTNFFGGGRTQASNFFAFDSSNQMSIFEAGMSSWVEYPLRPGEQFAVRGNYSYSGPPPARISEWGLSRHNRARQLIDFQLSQGSFQFDSMFSVARDVAPEGWQPLHFSYAAVSDTIAFHGSICRNITVSTIVIQGQKNTPTGTLPAVCWFLLGRPIATIAVPVWANQLAVSSLLSDNVAPSSVICNRARAILDSSVITSVSIESSRLRWLLGGVLGTERNIVNRVRPWLTVFITPSQAEAVSDSMAQAAYSTMQSLQPEVEMPSPPSYPTGFALSSPYPNPFNPVTSFTYTLAHKSPVRLQVFNSLGERIGSYQYGSQLAGTHTLQWDGSNRSNGIYWFQLETDDHVEWRKAILLK